MGIGGISIWQLLIIALIIVLLFGTKKLRSVGTDLGGALKGFKKAVKDDDEEEEKEKSDQEQIAEMDSDDDSAAEAAAKAKADAAAAEADRKKQSTASTRNEHSDKS